MIKKLILILLILLISGCTTLPLRNQRNENINATCKELQYYSKTLNSVADIYLMVFENDLVSVVYLDKNDNYRYDEGYLINKVQIRIEYEECIINIPELVLKNIQGEFVLIPVTSDTEFNIKEERNGNKR